MNSCNYRWLVSFLLCCFTATTKGAVKALQSQPTQQPRNPLLSRRTALATTLAFPLVSQQKWGTVVQPANAAAETPDDKKKKLLNLSDDELAEIVKGDVVERQFLVTADLTRSIYDESATFTDEIDTYTLDSWITGVKKLFNTEKSHIDLVDGSFRISKQQIELQFVEDLQFNLRLIKPVVSLSGRLVLQRDPTTGLITSYREYWDQDVNTVLKTARF